MATLLAFPKYDRPRNSGSPRRCRPMELSECVRINKKVRRVDFDDFYGAGEGSADSFDSSFHSRPYVEIIPSTPAAADVCERNGSYVIGGLTARLALHTLHPRSESAPVVHGIISVVKNKEQDVGSSVSEDESESLPAPSVEDVQCLQFSGSFGSHSSGEKSTDQNRFHFLKKLSTAASHLGLTPQSLYWAVCLFDTCVAEHCSKGRIVDAVQQEILSLTCLFVAHNKYATVKLSPDEFVKGAQVAEGTVKGRMIECQMAVVERLGKSTVNLDVWSWLHMARFVLHLCDCGYADQFLPCEVIAAASFVVESTTEEVSSHPSEPSKTLLNFFNSQFRN